MCSCPAHRELVDCTCECDHTNDRLSQLSRRCRELEAEANQLRATLEGWLLAPHHDTGGEYGLYHDCNVDEAVIGISETSLRSVLDDVRDHECGGESHG